MAVREQGGDGRGGGCQTSHSFQAGELRGNVTLGTAGSAFPAWPRSPGGTDLWGTPPPWGRLPMGTRALVVARPGRTPPPPISPLCG